MIRFGCPHCGTMLKAAPEKAGKPMVCPRCHERCRAPARAAPGPIAGKDEGPSLTSAQPGEAVARDANQTQGLLSGMSGKVRWAAGVVAVVGVVSLLLMVQSCLLPVRRNMTEVSSTWATILGPGSVVLLLVILHGQGTSCPACRRWWMRTKVETEFVDREVFDRKGALISRSLYRTIYACESCRHRWSVTDTDEYPKSGRERQKQDKR